MKSLQTFCILSLAAGTTITHAQNFSVNFNNTGDFANNFNVYQNATPGNGSPYAQVTTGGVGNSGAVGVSPGSATATADATGIYKPVSFDFSATGATLSISSTFNVVANTATGNRLLQLGFVNENTSGMNGNAGLAFMSLRLSTAAATGNVYTPQFQDKTAAGATVSTSLTPNLTLAPGEWYQLSATFQNSGNGQFLVSGSLQDFGKDGLTAGATIFTFDPKVFSNADITKDGAMFAAFRGFNADGLGKIDNFSAAAVPEPGVVALMGLGAVGLLAGRWRER